MKFNLKQITQWIENNNEKPIFFMTAGLPGSGKSTLLAGIKAVYPDFVIASTDDYIESEGKKLGLNYSEAFKKISFSHAKTAFNLSIKSAIKEKKNLVIDQTNCGSKARKTKMKDIPPNYMKVCLVFDVPDKVLKERLATRARDTGKTIPDFVVKNMTDSWQTPTRAEGFDHIIEVVQ